MSVVCADDLNVLVLLSLGLAEERAALQGGGRSYRKPIKFRKTEYLTPRILLDTGHFYQTRNLSTAMEEYFQVTRLKGLQSPIPGASSWRRVGNETLSSNLS